MRVVLDTNIVVSGLLWHGSPRRVLDVARVGRLIPFTTAELMAELQDVLKNTFVYLEPKKDSDSR